MGGRGPVPARFHAWLALGLLYLLLTVFLTWPLAQGISAGIPLGTEAVATVPLFNLWTLAWNAESLSRFYDGYWQAPIFHPAPGTFALSEPQPLSGLLGAVLAVPGGSVVAGYNLLLMLFLASNGLLAAVALRTARLGWIPALAGGALVLVLPFLHQELGVLHLLPLGGVLALALSIVAFGRRCSLRRGLVLGAALAFAYLLSLQLAVFGALVLAPVALWLWWPQLGRGSTWGALFAGAGLFLLLASPVLVAQARARAEESFERSPETVRKLSARPVHYMRAAWEPLIPTPGLETAASPARRAFWPGTLRVALAVLGCLLAFRSDTRRRFALGACLVLVTALVLSFGPHLGVGGVSLVGALRWLPGVSQIRSYFRFALFVQLAVVALAALGLELIHRWARRKTSTRVAAGVVALLALAAIVEIRPAMGKIQELPPLDLDLPWISWVERSTGPDDVLAFVPFPEGRSAEAYLGTSQWMYWQMRHWRPMVNGYSGFFPERFRRLKKEMASFPDGDSLEALQEAGVRYCVVHRAFLRRPPGTVAGRPFLQRVFEDSRHGLEIYELTSPPGTSDAGPE